MWILGMRDDNGIFCGHECGKLPRDCPVREVWRMENRGLGRSFKRPTAIFAGCDAERTAQMTRQMADVAETRGVGDAI